MNNGIFFMVALSLSIISPSGNFADLKYSSSSDTSEFLLSIEICDGMLTIQVLTLLCLLYLNRNPNLRHFENPIIRLIK